jgi:hypothetical protein
MCRNRIKSLLTCCCLIVASAAFGQSPDMKSTLDFVNQTLGNSFEVSVEKGFLNVKFFDGGDLFREDNAACKDLDPKKITYNATDKVFSVNCLTGRDCVIRVYHIREIRRDYGRISFARELSASEVEKLTLAFSHMIKMVNDPKYKDTIALD